MSSIFAKSIFAAAVDDFLERVPSVVIHAARRDIMDLMCAEKISQDSCHAGKDRNVFEDERVLRDLLATEHLYVPQCDYFTMVQTDVKPFMRKVVTQWMLEVSDCTLVRLRINSTVLPIVVVLFIARTLNDKKIG